MAPPAKSSGFAALPTGVKLLLLFVLLGVVSAVYYFALHMQLSNDIEDAEQQYVELQNEMQEAQARQQEYLELTQELAAREAIDRQNKRVLPEDAEIAAFLQDLNRLAELSGLRIQRVEPRPEEPQQLYVRIPVTLSVEGRYHQVAKFFYNVSRLERAINMENVEIAEPEIEGEEVILGVSALATTFRRPTQQEMEEAAMEAQEEAEARQASGGAR